MADETPVEPTTDDVRTWLGIKSGVTNADTESVPIVLEAVTQFVESLPGEWTPRKRLGAVMLAGRLVRRRNSPAGVEAFTDGAAAYVRRSDPDVALMLELDTWRKPAIG